MPDSNDFNVLSCSKFYVSFDGLEDLLVKKVSGLEIKLATAGDTKPFGVSKGGKSSMQATVTGIENGKITIEYVDTVEDDRLMKWYEDFHTEPIKGGGSAAKGQLKTGSIVLYNQGGDEAVRWDLTGVAPASYKSAKFEAGSTELATETVEIVYHSLHRVK